MIWYYIWNDRKRDGRVDVCSGWYLFGVIPLYVRRDIGDRR